MSRARDVIQVVNAAEVKLEGSVLGGTLATALTRVEVVQRLNAPASATLTFHDTAIESESVLDNASLRVGTALTIGFKAEEGASATESFKGKIASIDFEVEAGTSYVTVRAHDGLQSLYHGTSLKTRKDVKYSDAVSQLASSAGLTADVEATTGVWRYLPQAWQSDGDFLASLASEIGFVFYARDGKLHFEKPKWSTDGGATVTYGESLLRFRTTQSTESAVKKVTVRAWDPTKKKSIAGIEPSVKANGVQLEKDPASLYEGSRELTVSALTVPDQAAARALATALADRIGDTTCSADGLASGDPKILPGVTLKVEGVPKVVAGKYYVSEARHVYDGEYQTEFRCTGALDALTPSPGPSQAGRAAMPQQQTHPFMVVPAIVTNNKYADAPENLGPRVKAKIPSLSDTDETDWLRLVSPDAGDKRGFLAVPEVGDEVLVAFAEGNLRMGFVIGGLYNGKDLPDKEMKEANTVVAGGVVNRRGIVSRSGHQVILDDKDGNERILIMDKTGKQQLLFNSKDSKILVESEGEQVELDGKGKKINITSKGDITLKADGKITLEAKADIVMKSTGKTSVEATQALELKGLSFKAEGQTTADLKGGTMAKVDGGAMTEVKGALVKIN